MQRLVPVKDAVISCLYESFFRDCPLYMAVLSHVPVGFPAIAYCLSVIIGIVFRLIQNYNDSFSKVVLSIGQDMCYDNNN